MGTSHKSRITDVKQHGIKLVNSNVENSEFQVTDYGSENRNSVIKITIMVDKKEKEIRVNKDDMPHHSPMISFVQYPSSVVKVIREHLNK